MSDTPVDSLDQIMDLDPLELTKENLDSIIAFHRKKRAEREAAGPRTRGKATKDTGASVALADLVKNMAKAAVPAGPVVKRRI